MRLLPDYHLPTPGVEGGTLAPHEDPIPVTITPHVLSLPSIDPAIPLIYSEFCNSKLLGLGKSLMAAGCPLEDTENKTIQQIIHEGVNRFIGEIVGEHIAELSIEDDDGAMLTLAFNMPLDGSPSFLCGDQLNTMHNTGKGLVEYALSALYKSCIPVMTPGDCMNVIQMIEWLGAADEKEFFAEMMDESVPEEDFDVLRLEDVLKVIPQWSLDACYADPKTLRGNVKVDRLDKEEKKLLAMLDQFVQLMVVDMADSKGKYLLCNGHNQFAAIMFMDDASRGGMYYQMLDHLFQQSMESSESEDNSLFMLCIDPHQEAHDWVELLRQCREAFSLIYRILPFLGTIL